MSDRDDTAVVALSVAIATALFAVAAVVAFASSPQQRPRGIAAETAEVAEGLGPVETLAFEPGTSSLPADARDALGRAADAARGDGALVVLVLPFCSRGADTPALALAEARARAVGHALQADGVAAARIILARPEPAPDREPGAADRVEIRLQ